MISQFPISHTLLLFITFSLGIASFSYFFIWSFSKIPSLNNAPAEIAIPSMNALNKTSKNFGQLSLLGLTPIAYICCGLLTQSIARHGGALFFYLSAITYVVGVIGVTFSISEPLNFRLAQFTPQGDTSAAQKAWRDYVEKWQFWNKIRTLSSGLALVLFFWGFVYLLKIK